MKTKSLHLLASALLLAFASCTSDIQELNTEQSPLLKQIVMTTVDFEPEAGSRTLYDIADGAVKCTWASNDTVGVFPDKGAQAYFPMTTGAGTKKAQFSGGGWTLTDGSTYAAYYPFIGDMYLNRNAVPVNYDGQKQVGNGSMAHLGDYDYMVATPTVPEFGSANFMFKHLSALVQLKLTIPQPATLTSVKLVAENKAFAQEGKVDIMADVPSITPATTATELELTLQDVSTTEENQVVTLYMMLPPTDLSNQTLKAVIASDKGNQEIALESKNFQAGKAYGLSGAAEDKETVGDGTYKDGVVSLAEAGTMKNLLGKDYLSITSLKVVGPINGDDVYYLRKMLGGDNFSSADWGKLEKLDLSDARIVEGGGWYNEYKYYSSPTKCYTTNDVIGVYMFNQCANLKEIVLPDGVTSIGDYAFSHCDALTAIDIPDNVISIDYAFSHCDALTMVTIGDGVTSIGSGAFYDCDALTTVTVGDGVTSIGSQAFESCNDLTSVYIKDLSAWCRITFGTSSSNPLFYGAKLYLDNKEVTELMIPEDITEIKYSAFCGCGSIVKVVIPDSVTSIGNSAFYNCATLTTIDIPDHVTSIGDYAFESCDALTIVTIGDGVTSIGYSVFYDCDALTTVTIGDGVTSIYSYAFCGCAALTTVTIGDSVTSISSEAFYYCYALTDFYCHATTPPSIYSSSFPKYGEKTTLHVPERCGSTYKSKWGSYFKNIVEMD